MEKTLTIDWKGEKKKVKIKEVTYGEKNRIIARHTKMKMVGANQIVETDPYELRMSWLEKAIVEAPFTTSRKAIEDIPAKLGDYLFNEITELNSVDEKKAETSDGQSSMEQETPTLAGSSSI